MVAVLFFSKFNLRRVIYLVLVAIVAVFLLVFWFFGRGYETDKFLPLTADKISNVKVSRSYLKRSETLSFVLKDAPYSFRDIVVGFAREAKRWGWQSSDVQNLKNAVYINERQLSATFVRGAEHLVIYVERLGAGYIEGYGQDEVLIEIIHEK